MRHLHGWLFLAALSAVAAFPAQNPVSPTVPVAAPPIKTPAIPAPAAPSSVAPVPVTPTVTTPTQAQPLTPDDLRAFFDGVFPLQLERSDIAGATVLVMKDGNILFEKGYGYADLKASKPVDPKSTIFRLASISKLFTWISVMQLEEQGKLNLDADVNTYIDFKIRPAFGKPVTLRNLMTHTGGFEEVIDNIIIVDPNQQPTLRDHLIHNQPMRLFPPGEVPAYSNYGVGLASYIVQRVSGEQFEQYVQDHIFTPLGMTHSSFYQPIQKSLAGSVSEGYRGSTLKPAVGFEMLNPVGAGGLSSSAADMGRFGQALLNGGELEGQRILKPETLARMWTPQFQANPLLPPACMGFYQNWHNNLRWIGHEGDLIAFHSLFFVEPTQKLLLFVSYNSAGGGSKPRPEIIDFFTDRYFPGAPSVPFLQNWNSDMRTIAGQYIPTRRADSTKLRINTLFNQDTAQVDKDGVLTISSFKDLRGHPEKYKPIGNDLWQSENDQDRIFAIRDSQKRVVRLALNFPGAQMERVPWYASNDWQLPVLFASLAILAVVVLASLSRIGYRLFFRRRSRLVPQPGTIWLTWAPRTASFLWIIFISSVAGFFAYKGDDFLPPTPAWFPWLSVINWSAGVCILFSLFAVFSAIRVWFRGDLRSISQWKFTLVTIACAFLSWLAVFYHVIGPARRI